MARVGKVTCEHPYTHTLGRGIYRCVKCGEKLANAISKGDQ